ncbi:hypothetical protein BL253_22820 [Pseudofrankia asymbiotica]|uniref:Uncharacterized protein n=1 Tax=Pseudofrankia asymbiotica TaxID=1834516 RepID=A0A1V2I6H8_9ACTN|nr:hypothetical protein BL253_22820 [Pseudofrankia asymbiotica]
MNSFDGAIAAAVLPGEADDAGALSSSPVSREQPTATSSVAAVASETAVRRRARGVGRKDGSDLVVAGVTAVQPGPRAGLGRSSGGVLTCRLRASAVDRISG